MPRYDFRCLNCGHEYEKWVSYSQKEAVTCPQCESKQKEIIFKATVKGPIANSTCSPSSGFS
ncbi:regulatory protein, FmdB family [Caldalkalibacillus thermarum TA2.A1]|uniref:Regulatory protein, FmdB family n=1 Tax=Caldalkalibacillus thermarum (strain TA2.A1) TaxID=986075 RepID=F5L797_CALTT|nr:zinc ribbon domain-containing protein [Caldalkalibacillus thermarum]EGL82788.1 regulatory protein, FmdB family [Caldalkalibacillus thermarum TA2.A1]QZT34764.1 zinc ribbon domain-containing protein [Caldalkalibacillus thermarum TA2.A1]GGK17404.1 hypothetical protein GCM10010965_08070 [Caldalkalibacillus thermarum]